MMDKYPPMDGFAGFIVGMVFVFVLVFIFAPVMLEANADFFCKTHDSDLFDYKTKAFNLHYKSITCLSDDQILYFRTGSRFD